MGEVERRTAAVTQPQAPAAEAVVADVVERAAGDGDDGRPPAAKMSMPSWARPPERGASQSSLKRAGPATGKR